MELYKDSKVTIQNRIVDLLERMTVEEKIGQMLQLNALEAPFEEIKIKMPGSFLNAVGKQTRKLQEYNKKETRLGIPLLFAIDAIHGHSFFKGATIFPTQIGLASTWNTDLIKKVASITAREMAYTGVHWTFSPVLCLARDLRWGRIGETFGEDTYLIGEFSKAMIEGYQGADYTERENVAACAKHFAGYSETHGGRDAGEADISRRKLSSYFFPPFKKAAEAGCATFMTGYESIDGVPCTINRWLLTDVLRKEWKFEGVVVTDWNNVERLYTEQKVCTNLAEASAKSVIAGNDLIMSTPGFFNAALEAVKKGMLSIEYINKAVSRILKLKFSLVLFENDDFYNEKKAIESVSRKEHREAALEVALSSIVLLKNEGHILPLYEKRMGRVAVIGPNADDPLETLGDWSLGSGQMGEGSHPRSSIVTVLDGIRKISKGSFFLNYVKGCDFQNPSYNGIQASASLAQKSDVVILVLGDYLAYIGEECSTARLELPGKQLELAKAVYETGTPVVCVLINSKPLAIQWIADHLPAIIEAWNPGVEGGTAVAKILFGKENPEGKLPVSFAKHVGQLPVYYNQLPGQHGESYADMDQKPLFPFGHGLTYTTFDIGGIIIENPNLSKNKDLKFSVSIKNTGDRVGKEVVQCYIDDHVTSLTWPHKMLKSYKRISLEPGEGKELSFTIPYNDLGIIDGNENFVVEPGEFTLMVGTSSVNLKCNQFEVL